MKFLLKLLLTIAVVAGLGMVYEEPLNDLMDSRTVLCEDKLRETFLTLDDSVFLGGYNLTEAELNRMWNHLTNTYGDLFHLSPRYEYTTTGGRVLTVTPEYTMTAEEYEQALQEYKAAIMDIVLTVDPRWTPLQTALYLHDYIAMHYAYDETTIRNSAYDMLTTGTSVCQGYTLLYQDLLNACGIPCTYIISEEMRHTWNIVYLDGSWYHVDVTHDDPVSDCLGKAQHKNFLRSDLAMSNHIFTPEEGYGTCTNTTFDSGTVWEGVTSAFVPVDDAFYYIQDGSLYKWMMGDTYYIDTIYAIWYTDDTQTSYWQGHYSTLWGAGDLLLYSKPDVVMSYHPETGKFTTVYRYDGPGDIYGMQYIDGVLKLQISSSPNEPGEIITVDNITLPI